MARCFGKPRGKPRPVRKADVWIVRYGGKADVRMQTPLACSLGITRDLSFLGLACRYRSLAFEDPRSVLLTGESLTCLGQGHSHVDLRL